MVKGAVRMQLTHFAPSDDAYHIEDAVLKASSKIRVAIVSASYSEIKLAYAKLLIDSETKGHAVNPSRRHDSGHHRS